MRIKVQANTVDRNWKIRWSVASRMPVEAGELSDCDNLGPIVLDQLWLTATANGLAKQAT